MMGAVLADGVTRLKNAACEPEIVDLAIALRSMGAQISGEGTPEITITGVTHLSGMKHSVVPDRVEAFTFLCAGLITGGRITVNGIKHEYLDSALSALEVCGGKISFESNSVTVESLGNLKPLEIATAPFPGFPTDMQAQLMAVLTQAQGESIILDTIFENRFMHVPELSRMGAKILIQGNRASIQGPVKLTGATVMATDLRASASLIVAALAAKGTSYIRRIYHLDRGYEALEKKFTQLGADIVREKETS
jgi:UDP-N-acetylglucosamine 1-carboxyvinyltransferase